MKYYESEVIETDHSICKAVSPGISGNGEEAKKVECSATATEAELPFAQDPAQIVPFAVPTSEKAGAFSGAPAPTGRRRGRPPGVKNVIPLEKRPFPLADQGSVGGYATSGSMCRAADRNEIPILLGSYLEDCRNTEKLPNLAGFCRFCGCGIDEFRLMRDSHREIGDAVTAALEDEALNAGFSSSVLSVYLKLRLGYGCEEKSEKSSADAGTLRLIFDHDAYADGE